MFSVLLLMIQCLLQNKLPNVYCLVLYLYKKPCLSDHFGQIGSLFFIKGNIKSLYYKFCQQSKHMETIGYIYSFMEDLNKMFLLAPVICTKFKILITHTHTTQFAWWWFQAHICFMSKISSCCCRADKHLEKKRFILSLSLTLAFEVWCHPNGFCFYLQQKMEIQG